MRLSRARVSLGFFSRTFLFMYSQVPYEIPPKFLTGSSENPLNYVCRVASSRMQIYPLLLQKRERQSSRLQ